jgi:hypothetical protein
MSAATAAQRASVLAGRSVKERKILRLLFGCRASFSKAAARISHARRDNIPTEAGIIIVYDQA